MYHSLASQIVTENSFPKPGNLQVKYLKPFEQSARVRLAILQLTKKFLHSAVNRNHTLYSGPQNGEMAQEVVEYATTVKLPFQLI